MTKLLNIALMRQDFYHVIILVMQLCSHAVVQSRSRAVGQLTFHLSSLISHLSSLISHLSSLPLLRMMIIQIYQQDYATSMHTRRLEQYLKFL